MTYCTYLTIYRGNKFPMFYIGSTKTERVACGYHGSVSSVEYKTNWKEELSNNSHLFKTIILTTHVSRQDAYKREEAFHTALNVAKSSMYINKSIARKDGWFGVGKSGKDNPAYGKSYPKSNDVRIANSKLHKGKVLSLHTRSLLSIARKGKPTTKGKKFPSEINGMCGKHHTGETKQKLSLNSKQLKHTEQTRQYLSERRQKYNGPLAWEITHPIMGRYYTNSLTKWCKEFGLNYNTVYTQYKNNKLHKSFTFRLIGKYIKLMHLKWVQ